MKKTAHRPSIIRFFPLSVLILAIVTDFIDPVFAEVLELGKLPKDEVSVWCGAHGSTLFDGGSTYACMTQSGAAILCDKDTCKGWPSKIQERMVPRPGVADSTGQLRLMFPGPGTTAVAATIDIKCANGQKFTLTTGTKGGICRPVFDGHTQSVSGGYCTDGQEGGGGASVNCATGCTGTTGAGNCTAK